MKIFEEEDFDREQFNENIDYLCKLDSSGMIFDRIAHILLNGYKLNKTIYLPNEFFFKRIALRKTKNLWNNLNIRFDNIYLVSKKSDIKFIEADIKNYDKTSVLKRLTKTNPFDIPVNFKKIKRNSKSYGFTYKSIVFDNILIQHGITLASENMNLMISIYSHELGHTQVDFKRGNCLNENAETLPIILENIAAINTTPSGKLNQFLYETRIKSLTNYIQDLSYFKLNKNYALEYIQFIRGFIQSQNFIKLYISSPDYIKKEMLDDINRIFSFQISLEDMLNKYDSDCEQIPPKILIK